MQMSYDLEAKVSNIINLDQPETLVFDHVSPSVNYTPTNVVSYSNGSLSVTVPINDMRTVVDRLAYIRTKIRYTFAGTVPDANPLIRIGSFDAPQCFPFQNCVDNTSIRFNNVSFNEETRNCLSERLRSLNNDWSQRVLSGAPSQMDYYQQFSDATSLGQAKNPLATLGSNWSSTPRGGFTGITVVSNTTTGAVIDVESYEPIMCEPFTLLSNAKGLVGVSNISFNFSYSNLERGWSHDASSPVTISSVSAVINDNPILYVRQLSLNELKTAIPRMVSWNTLQYTPYLSSIGTVGAGSSSSATSQAIQLSTVPDLIAIFVRKQKTNQLYTDSNVYSRINSLTLQIGNRQGLLASASPLQLYQLSQKNGLNMSWTQWHSHSGSLIYLKPEDFGLDLLQVGGSLSKLQIYVTVNFTNINASSQVLELGVVPFNMNTVSYESESGLWFQSQGQVSSEEVARVPVSEDNDYPDHSAVGSGFFRSVGRVFKGAKRLVRGSRQVFDKIQPFLRQASMLDPTGVSSSLLDKADLASDVLKRVGLGRLQGGRAPLGGATLRGGGVQDRQEVVNQAVKWNLARDREERSGINPLYSMSKH